MPLKKVKLIISGSEYTVSTDEDEAYVRELGEQIDRQMKQVMDSGARISANMAAVLVALTMADEAKKANDAADRLREQMKGYLDDNACAHQEADAARREAEALRHELQDFRRRTTNTYSK